MQYIQAKGILSAGNGMNLYRGCQHGCIYCDARSDCYQIGPDFSDVRVKENGLTLLESALRAKRSPCMIGFGAMSDPYTPLERTLGMTRRALQLVEKYGFGVALQTKSPDVLRDLDVLQRIRQRSHAVVQMTLTTMDPQLCRLIEPGVSDTRQRYLALKTLQQTGIPTVVWLCPVLPFLNDTEENIRGILSLCADAGVRGVVQFGVGMTLRAGSREYFYQQLDRKFPGLKARYIRAYGNAYVLSSPNSDRLLRFFHETCDRYGLWHNNEQIFRFMRTLPPGPMDAQLRLF